MITHPANGIDAVTAAKAVTAPTIVPVTVPIADNVAKTITAPRAAIPPATPVYAIASFSLFFQACPPDCLVNTRAFSHPLFFLFSVQDNLCTP